MYAVFLFPLTFLSNAFVPADTLPDWLHWFVDVNPLSHLISAVRDLLLVLVAWGSDYRGAIRAVDGQSLHVKSVGLVLKKETSLGGLFFAC